MRGRLTDNAWGRCHTMAGRGAHGLGVRCSRGRDLCFGFMHFPMTSSRLPGPTALRVATRGAVSASSLVRMLASMGVWLAVASPAPALAAGFAASTDVDSIPSAAAAAVDVDEMIPPPDAGGVEPDARPFNAKMAPQWVPLSLCRNMTLASRETCEDAGDVGTTSSADNPSAEDDAGEATAGDRMSTIERASAAGLPRE